MNINYERISGNFLPTFRKNHSAYLQLYWPIFKGQIYKFIDLWGWNHWLSQSFGRKLPLRSK